MIAPGSVLGVLGGGQLGLMFALAARRLDYDVWVFDPDPKAPAAAVAARHFCAPFTEDAVLAEFCAGVAAVTVEREQIPLSTLAYCAERLPLRPGPEALRIAQDRRLEKAFFRDLGLVTAPFALLEQAADLPAAAQLAFPAILKTAQDGYDGKGQVAVASAADLATAWQELGQRPALLEARVALRQEFSVILARSSDGLAVFYPIAENRHRHGILDLSIVPCELSEAHQEQARRAALRIAEALEYVGVLAVEFFLSADGELLVNEMAPRPHNSGHYTLDACVHSQFDQQVRALTGLPLGDTRLLSPVAMLNLLGEWWQGAGPDWNAWLCHPQVKPYLYGKSEARPGRKMGHLNILAESRTAALRTVAELCGADSGY
ncbi:5-(carboxyamino)imidazole ribonucleotide synthase [Acidithiobacillus sp. CV18-2]|uniref:N5-carboxyaminoimidazole ribonucleotide synthase n=1 Tax=Igneacidithiobacillus copahuensis TaxID=2724909 RepID=A0AAE2YML2_9PROT|nr:5-(carboxyamino)imidazole ribonucleotide synthase [Igneacidithiobacillus copahuensis]MBU2755369.1 5-(carboxyamino)imidazole ribonucleotide synthase [Acidithiobacillus sp. CV18-3]MBU2758591.1 5-(carboxyamino)imidazole ribonucleotide synthase [Acidithiobacillus sp. BN09-2]MBU2777347.1 5-(carboxyamino)imidazole ribonucleotide synthase [Acidithiobacillus sp. CV18-2]MBU2797771.1 5-(carboxyamino)imidazole ribonucleotide synthase [Acidithiobacillus sp. VAN18-2]MBU2798532.1 5-(carboxyamino)imidazol